MPGVCIIYFCDVQTHIITKQDKIYLTKFSRVSRGNLNTSRALSTWLIRTKLLEYTRKSWSLKKVSRWHQRKDGRLPGALYCVIIFAAKYCGFKLLVVPKGISKDASNWQFLMLHTFQSNVSVNSFLLPTCKEVCAKLNAKSFLPCAIVTTLKKNRYFQKNIDSFKIMENTTQF